MPPNKTDEPNTKNVLRAPIVVDTNVIQAAGHKDKAKSTAVTKHLESLRQSGYPLIICEITLYEHIQNLWGDEAYRAEKNIRTFEWKQISTKVLKLGAVLAGLYRQESERYRDISVADKLIAATAILETGFVLTSNHADFPAPFFTLEQWTPISFSKGHSMQTLDIGLYKANNPLIARRIEDLDRKHTKPIPS